MLRKYFPPWTVTCETWHAVLRPGVSGIPTDVMLFISTLEPVGAPVSYLQRLSTSYVPAGNVIRKLTVCQSGYGGGPVDQLEPVYSFVGAASSPGRQDHSAPVSTSPMWKAKCTAPAVSFAADVEVIVSTPVPSNSPV